MNKTTRKTLFQLFIPIFAESLLMLLVGSVDTLMVSKVNDTAAGSIGSSNSFIALFIISFHIISSGVMAVMTQFIGAEKESVAVKALKIGLFLNTILGVILSSVLFIFAEQFVHLMNVPPVQFDDALIYTQIIGATLFLNAITPILSSYLRAFGHSALPMYSSITANLINALFNAIWIFGLFGAPVLGVKGVALATAISKIFNLLINLVFALIMVHPKEDNYQIKNTEVLGKIIKIGLPAALETTLYNIAMAMVSRMINGMDQEGINNTARSYAQTITHFSYVVAMSLASANSIMVGWAIGEKRQEEAYKFTLKRWKIGTAICIGVATIVALLSNYFVGLFTDNQEILRICRTILFIDIALEFGRATNLILGIALKNSGDALYTVIIAIIFMFICSVTGSYIFGIKLELMVAGCYIGLALDEIVRGLFMLFRWRSKKWMEKSLIK